MNQYIQKLRKWRDKFEEKLDRRPRTASLENYGQHLSEFRFKKFEEVEVPGQYLQHRDKNQDFVRIERFLPNVDLVRTVGFSHRRLKIRGHDGSVHAFAIQHPAARHCRREERTLQLFRIFNTTLSKRKESRRRNLNFHLPLIQPLAPSLRLVQDDPSYISLQGIYEDHCRRTSADRDSPILFTLDRMCPGPQGSGQESINPALRMEIFTAITSKWAPNDIALQYFQGTYPSFPDFFLFRRQFSYQLAALTFMTYVMHMSSRYPNKLTISRATGNIWGSELTTALVSNRPFFYNAEQVPFRLTPNLQMLMGPLATEGLFSAALMAIARCLTEVHHEPGNELEQQLSIFVRDEMIFWFTQQKQQGPWEPQLRETVQTNSELVVKRAVSLAKPPEGTLPANQTVVDLIARAVDPKALGLMDALWMAWL
jgi:transformation/transcription domain-associated protein